MLHQDWRQSTVERSVDVCTSIVGGMMWFALLITVITFTMKLMIGTPRQNDSARYASLFPPLCHIPGQMKGHHSLSCCNL